MSDEATGALPCSDIVFVGPENATQHASAALRRYLPVQQSGAKTYTVESPDWNEIINHCRPGGSLAVVIQRMSDALPLRRSVPRRHGDENPLGPEGRIAIAEGLLNPKRWGDCTVVEYGTETYDALVEAVVTPHAELPEKIASESPPPSRSTPPDFPPPKRGRPLERAKLSPEGRRIL